MADVLKAVKEEIKSTHILVYSKTTCGYCTRVKQLLKVQNFNSKVVELDKIPNGAEIQAALFEITKQKTVPNVFVNGSHIGGSDVTIALFKKGVLAQLVKDGESARDPPTISTYDYDLIVIGGGSGGLACAKEAAGFKDVRVCCLDFVKPTPYGTEWKGLGGTCVNVGCIPKKLMHQASLLGEGMEDARKFGWAFSGKTSHEWTKMFTAIRSHISSLNWNYRTQLSQKHVTYRNSLAEFMDPHTVKHTSRRGEEGIVTGARIVVAVGGRPRYPDIPGAKEFGITSDDLFFMENPPGKTLVVGASYVALECAGFLTGLGFHTTCMVRSILLRGFDQQMANKAGEYMRDHGVNFMVPVVPTKVELVSEGPPRLLRVHYKNLKTQAEGTKEFNTVLFAVGRDPDTKTLGLEKAGVTVTKSGHIPTVYEQTNVPHIYAIGDVQVNKSELTPLAIQSGKLLARRLFGESKLHTDYINVPTTVFTPLEYGCIGFSEDDANLIFGKDNIEVYHVTFQPLEFTVPNRDANECYMKLICFRDSEEKVIGLHVLSPNAGEITQGFALAFKLGATKADFDSTIGIHPTCSEGFTTLSVTKRSGADSSAGSC